MSGGNFTPTGTTAAVAQPVNPAPTVSAGEQPSIFGQSASAYNQGLNTILGAANANPMTTAGAAGLAGAMAPGAVPFTMNQYLNPYQDQVIGATLGRMRDEMSMGLNNVRSQAAQAGAYGGARQGLVEAELMDRYQRNMGEAAAQMNMQGFNTAANLGQNRIAQLMQGGGSLANLGLAQNQQQLAAGQAALGGATTGFNLGQAALQQQAAAGNQIQNMNQNILGQAAGQYEGYVNYPNTALGTALAGLQGNPLQAAQTSTGTYKPGLFQWAQLGGSMYNAGK